MERFCPGGYRVVVGGGEGFREEIEMKRWLLGLIDSGVTPEVSSADARYVRPMHGEPFLEAAFHAFR